MQEHAYPKKEKKSVAGQFAAVKYRSGTYSWTQKLNREDYVRGRQVRTSCCCKRVKTVEKQWTLLRSLDQFSRLRFEISRLRLRFLAGWDLLVTTSRLDSRLTVAYPLGVLLKGSVSPVSHCLKCLCRFDQIILFPLLVEFPDHVFWHFQMC
jgi:hypothetical protein